MRRTIRVQGGDPIELPIYSGNENVSGTVDISVPPGKKIEHQGIRIEMIGQTGMNVFLLEVIRFLKHNLSL